MKQYIISICLILIAFSAKSQDIITTTDGDNISSKVVRVTKKNVKYRLFDSEDTALRSIPKLSVSCIRYEDGGKEVFNESKVDDDNDEGKWDKDGMKDRGQRDAKIEYDGYQGAKLGTAITAALTGPILGLVPAIACSSTPPREESLGDPDRVLMKDGEYSDSYKKEARRIKSKKVWNGYIVGVVIEIAVAVLVIAL